MLTAPYSIYVNNRPLRVAFLVEDNPGSMRIIDAIFSYSRDRWGGRYNALVITDGETLTDAWWSLLEMVDPDVVASFVRLSDDLIAKIERRISPFLIQQPNDCEQQEETGPVRINLPHNGMTILPTPLNVRRAGGSESSLVLFEMSSKATDPLTKRFIEWNCGEYSHPTMAVSRALEGVR